MFLWRLVGVRNEVINDVDRDTLLARATPDVSVITPAHNTAPWLAECVASVAAQRDVAVEHLIVDDGSTDSTPQLIADLAARYPHIRAYRLARNKGQAGARNLTLDRAVGEFVVFLDSDDRLHGPDVLVRAVAEARATGADILACRHGRFDDKSEVVRQSRSLAAEALVAGLRAAQRPEVLNVTSCWQMVLRRSFLEAHGLRFAASLRQREDRPFVTECLLRADNIALSDLCLIDYRLRPGSTMGRLDLEQLALFTRHVAIVGHQMRTLAAGQGFADLRRANMLYYMNAVLSYWRAFLLRQDVWESRALERFLGAWRSGGWDCRDLWQDRVIGNVNIEHRDNGYFDVLAFALCRSDRETVRNLLLKERLSLPQLERIAAVQDGEAGIDAPVLTDLAFNRFCASTRLRRPAVGTRTDPLPADLPIVLHAGSTKTGSSSLQKFMEFNRFRLLREDGTFYPLTGIESGRGVRLHRTSGHAALLETLARDGAEACEALAVEVSQLSVRPARLVLSCENIVSPRFWDGGRILEKVAAALAHHPLTVVVYLRDQADWLESMYRESVTSPGLRLTQDMAAFVEETERTGLLDHDNIARAFAEALPRAQLMFRSYDLVTTAHRDVIDDFAAAVGLPVAGHVPFSRPEGALRNPTARRRAVQLIRAANRVPVPREKVPLLNDRLSNIAEQATGPRHYFLSGEDALAVRRRYETPNRVFWAQREPDAVGLCPADALVAEPRPAVETGETLTPRQLDAFAQALAEALSGSALPVRVGPLPPSERDEAQHRRTADWILATRADLARTRNPELAKRLKTVEMIVESDLFDAVHYLALYPRASSHPGGALVHYVETWSKLYLDPNVAFSTRDYLRMNADVAAAKVNPLVHYIRFGRAEGRVTVLDQ